MQEAKSNIAARMTAMLQRHIRAVEEELRAKAATMAARKRDVVLRQRQQRAALEQANAARSLRETQERAARFAKGIRGLWDRLTGMHANIRARNESEADRARERDRTEKDRLVFQHLDERREQARDAKAQRQGEG